MPVLSFRKQDPLDSRATLLIFGLPGAGKTTLAKHIEANADIAMPQDALNRLRIDLPLVHEPGAQAVPQVV